MPGNPCDPVAADVDKCVAFLKELELTWPGAARSRTIIEQLMKEQGRRQLADAGGEDMQQPSLPSSLAAHDFDHQVDMFPWLHVPGAELFGSYSGSGIEGLDIWGMGPTAEGTNASLG